MRSLQRSADIWTLTRTTTAFRLSAAGAGCGYALEPEHWHDLWLSRPEGYLVGWGTGALFRRPNPLPQGSRHACYRRTRTANYWAYVRDLEPLASLAGSR